MTETTILTEKGCKRPSRRPKRSESKWPTQRRASLPSGPVFDAIEWLDLMLLHTRIGDWDQAFGGYVGGRGRRVRGQ